MPAAFGNIVGLKPTVGSVSARGMVPACRSIDTISVFARSVDEALAVQRVIAGFDAEDPYSRRAPFPHLLRRGGAVAPRASRWAMWRRCAIRMSRRRISRRGVVAAGRPGRYGAVPGSRAAAVRGTVGSRAHARRCGTCRDDDRTFCIRRRGRSWSLDCIAARVDAFDAFHLLQQARRQAALLFAQYDALLLPTAPFCPTLAEVDGRSARSEPPPGHVHQFRQSVRHGRLRGAHRVRADGSADRRRAAGSRVVRGPAGAVGRRAASAVRHDRRRDRAGVAASGGTGRAGSRRDRAVLHRRAYGRPAAEQPDHHAGRPLLARRVDRSRPTGCSRWATGPGMLRAPTVARRSPARSGRCRPPRSARCWRRCRRRWALVRCCWTMAPASVFWQSRPASAARPRSPILAAGAPGCESNPED